MQLIRKLYYALSPNARLLVRRLFFLPCDLYSHAFKSGKELVPPRGLIFIGSGDFVEQGKHLLQLVIDHTGLTPKGTILDVGCGIGRLAVPLTRYMNKEGRYEGFDIVKTGIDWCNKNIASKYPNFHFLWVNLKNDLYNLSTSQESTSFIFPYPTNSFDSIVLTSVFTHMLPRDVKHYLNQINNVLRPDGKCLATFFILNEEIKAKMSNNKTEFNFKYPYDGYYLMDSKVKEANVAYEESLLRAMIDECGLKISFLDRGRWTGHKNSLDFQDVVIIEKK